MHREDVVSCTRDGLEAEHFLHPTRRPKPFDGVVKFDDAKDRTSKILRQNL